MKRRPYPEKKKILKRVRNTTGGKPELYRPPRVRTANFYRAETGKRHRRRRLDPTAKGGKKKEEEILYA